MKYRIILFLYSVLNLLFFSCTKVGQENPVVSKDLTKPDPISNVKVKNLNGAAIITYSLPQASNLLYVQADYIINEAKGIKRQSKSSYYSDTTIVEGFAEAKEYSIELKAVSRAGIASEPVTVKVHPDTPPYQLVRQTLTLNPDFSGITASAANPLRKKIGVVMLYDDPDYGRYVIREQNYSDFEKISYSTRGFDTLPKKMGAYIIDEFGNVSDTLYEEIEPLYEIALDKSKYFAYTLPTDKPPYTGNYSVEHIYNGLIGEDLWHTAILAGPDAAYPYYCSFGLGLKSKLSRFTLWERPAAAWGSMNAKEFSIWGSDKDRPADVRLTLGQPEGTVIGDWVNLGNFRYPDPPSGNIASTSTVTAADIAFLNAGVDFLIPSEAPPVKFIRVSVESTWGNTNFAGISDIKFFGDQRIR
ncbi:DUF4959 domain-containing protein [Niabella aquatica]